MRLHTCFFESRKMQTLYHSIQFLITGHPDAKSPIRGRNMLEGNRLENAWLLCRDGKIAALGTMPFPEAFGTGKQVDCSGKIVLPTYVDSHTHIVFAATREEEFVDRIQGMSYEEIAARGGGILNSARRLQAASEEQLYEAAYARALSMMSQGTGALEIKSGYGLTPETELKMLRVIARLKKALPIPVKATFLGAHAFPAEFKTNHEGYIHSLLNGMLPAIANEQLADYIDVFCDRGFFSPDETSRILEAGAHYGLKAKIHGNEMGLTGGVQVAVKHKALSVDHLEHLGDEELELLGTSQTIATVLPGTSFFLGIPYAPARQLIDSGAAVAIASDHNPGSSPNGRMGFMLSLACIKMKLLPQEALNACTVNAAFALELASEAGSIGAGRPANFIITKQVTSFSVIPYMFGQDMIDSVIINDKKI